MSTRDRGVDGTRTCPFQGPLQRLPRRDTPFTRHAPGQSSGSEMSTKGAPSAPPSLTVKRSASGDRDDYLDPWKRPSYIYISRTGSPVPRYYGSFPTKPSFCRDFFHMPPLVNLPIVTFAEPSVAVSVLLQAQQLPTSALAPTRLSLTIDATVSSVRTPALRYKSAVLSQ